MNDTTIETVDLADSVRQAMRQMHIRREGFALAQEIVAHVDPDQVDAACGVMCDTLNAQHLKIPNQLYLLAGLVAQSVIVPNDQNRLPDEEGLEIRQEAFAVLLANLVRRYVAEDREAAAATRN